MSRDQRRPRHHHKHFVRRVELTSFEATSSGGKVNTGQHQSHRGTTYAPAARSRARELPGS
eukprot:8349802-Pyramimonas_sp.AAC.1